MSGFAAKEMHATQCVTMIEECLTETPVPPLEVLMMLARQKIKSYKDMRRVYAHMGKDDYVAIT